MQSNLWAMTDELAELLARYEVRVGTSVDGPEDMHDVQQGEGSYEAYRADPAHARVTSIDAMAEGVMCGRGVSCVFSARVGSFAAIGPDGGVYPCQRFCGMGEFCLGNVCDGGGLTAAGVEASAVWESLVSAQTAKERACGGCAHVAYCHGGCLYHALAAGMVRDLYCAAYKETFDRISRDMALEMGEVLLGTGAPTPTLAMAGERPHPFELWIKRDRALRAWELGRSDEPFAVTHLRSRHPENDLNKLYLHITFSCPLRCDHCYADGACGRSPRCPLVVWRTSCAKLTTRGFVAWSSREENLWRMQGSTSCAGFLAASTARAAHSFCAPRWDFLSNASGSRPWQRRSTRWS